MRSGWRAVVEAGTALVLLSVVGHLSQAAAKSNDGTTLQTKAVVQLGSVQAQSGTTVVIPVALVTSGDVALGALELKIPYSPKLLKHTSTVPGPAGLEAKVTVAVEETASNDETVLRLTIRLPPGGSASRLPEGVLAQVSFDIAPEAANVGSIVLKNNLTAWGPGDPGREVTAIMAEDSWLDVSGPQEVKVFGCFFYMH